MANTNGFAADLARHIGQTVTIFTTSGGQSGRGFTGVLVSVNPCFVRLITQIGSAPGCALGNCCDRRRDCDDRISDREDRRSDCDDRRGNVGNVNVDRFGEDEFDNDLSNPSEVLNVNESGRRSDRESLGGQGRATCNRFTLGSVIDIPVNRIASFVHNAIGSGW